MAWQNRRLVIADYIFAPDWGARDAFDVDKFYTDSRRNVAMLELGYTYPFMRSWLACVVAQSIVLSGEGMSPHQWLGVDAICVGPLPLGAGTK